MDMSFSPRDWPQMRREPRETADSVGPEWRDLLARLDAAQAARLTLNDAGELERQGSFSPGSARKINSLEASARQDLGKEDDAAINLEGSANGKPVEAEDGERTGNGSPVK